MEWRRTRAGPTRPVEFSTAACEERMRREMRGTAGARFRRTAFRFPAEGPGRPTVGSRLWSHKGLTSRARPRPSRNNSGIAPGHRSSNVGLHRLRQLAQLPERSDRSSSAGAAICGGRRITGPPSASSAADWAAAGTGSPHGPSAGASPRSGELAPLLLLNTYVFAPARRYDHHEAFPASVSSHVPHPRIPEPSLSSAAVNLRRLRRRASRSAATDRCVDARSRPRP